LLLVKIESNNMFEDNESKMRLFLIKNYLKLDQCKV